MEIPAKVLSMKYWLKRALTRPRVVFRAVRKVGLATTLRLVRIRFGSSSAIFTVRIARWPNPVYVRGGKSSDTTVLYELLVADEYAMLDLLGSAPATILDGGANVGLTAAYFLYRSPSAKLIAVEPFPDTFNVCQRNLAPFGDRAVALRAAIWSHAGRVCLEPESEEWLNKVRAADGTEAETAEAVTMNWLVAELGGSVDLLKLDVEGSEKEIFAEDAREWLPAIRNIVVETHGPEHKRRVFDALSEYDYDLASRDNVYFFQNLRAREARAAQRAGPSN